MVATTGTKSDLDELERRAHFELDCLGYPTRQWIVPRRRNGTIVHDVVIVGGGQSGISIAFRLLRERITNLRVLDRNPEGFEGPWLTFARMRQLRTPKTVTGPDLGIPGLSARAWWQAQFGEQSWEGLDKIPRELWQAYLLWVRKTVGIDVSNETEVTGIEPLDDLLVVHARSGGATEKILARKVVLATGIEGSGCWTVPAGIAEALPPNRYAHTSDRIDFASLSGRRVAVIGAGASAFDNAAMALESGAESVELLVRRKQLPTVNPNRWMEFAGFLRHFGDLDDARKWCFMKLIFEMNQPPPQETFDRCTRYKNFSMRLGCTLEHVRFEDDKIILATSSSGTKPFDFLIVGTGFTVDLAARPELARFHDKIARWSDRYHPPDGEEHPLLGAYPYLSPNFQFTEKTRGSAPFLANIFSYTFAAMPSLACSAGISALKFGLDRIAIGISRGLFIEDADTHLQSLRDYDEQELDLTAYRTTRAFGK